MNVPEELILDLLPLYMAGETSPATKAFVEQVLARDPGLAKKVRAIWDKELAGGLGPIPPPELELQALRKTRRILGFEKWIFGLAIAFTATAFAVVIPMEGDRIGSVHFAIQDHPVPLGISAGLGLLFWLAYFIFRRKLRTTL